MFVDQVMIHAKAGSGGSGCTSVHREKFKPLGGPDGGNGGKGGDVVLVVDPNVTTLLEFHRHPHQDAPNGKPGQGSHNNGANGPDLLLSIPAGTVVYSMQNEILADLVKPDMRYVIAEGGAGGLGNAALSSNLPRLRAWHPADHFFRRRQLSRLVSHLRDDLRQPRVPVPVGQVDGFPAPHGDAAHLLHDRGVRLSHGADEKQPARGVEQGLYPHRVGQGRPLPARGLEARPPQRARAAGDGHGRALHRDVCRRPPDRAGLQHRWHGAPVLQLHRRPRLQRGARTDRADQLLHHSRAPVLGLPLCGGGPADPLRLTWSPRSPASSSAASGPSAGPGTRSGSLPGPTCFHCSASTSPMIGRWSCGMMGVRFSRP